MRPVALFVSGINADHMPAGLHEDRARLHGLPPPSIEAVRKAAVRNLHLVRPQIQWLADMLQDGRAYLLGGQPCIADFAAYHVVWFFRGRHIDCRPSSCPTRACWRGATAWRRSATASAPTSMPASRWPRPAHAEPATPARTPHPQEGDPLPGEPARVRSADNARDWVEGEVSFVDTHEIALLRHDPDVGRVAVHFPRLGYDWRRA